MVKTLFVGLTCPVGGCKKKAKSAFYGTVLEYTQENLKRHLMGANEHLMDETEAAKLAQDASREEWYAEDAEQTTCRVKWHDEVKKEKTRDDGRQRSEAHDDRRQRSGGDNSGVITKFTAVHGLRLRTAIERASSAASHSKSLAESMAASFVAEQRVLDEALAAVDQILEFSGEDGVRR